MESTYFIDIIILLFAAVVAVPLFQIVRFGAVPGFLIAGVIVGPYGFGLISNIADIRNLAEIGVVFLLFVIGIELKPSRLWQMRRMVFGLGSLQVLLTGTALSAICYFTFDMPMRSAILVGPALALSSTAFVLQLLSEQRLLTSKYGRTSISVLLLQDLAVVPLLALVPLLTLPELSIGEDVGLALIESMVILVLVVLAGRYFLHPLLHRVALSRNPELFTASAVLIVLGTALITEHAGFSMAMGAFLAGLLISDSSYKHQILAEIHPFRGLLLGLFFMSMGMSLNVNVLLAHPLETMALVLLLIGIKIGILFPLTYLFKIKLRKGLAVALLLAQSGEFALVLFSLAFESDLLTKVLFEKLLLIVLLSMLVTPLLAGFANKLIKLKDKKKIVSADKADVAPIVLAGFGRVGHRIGDMLSMAGLRYVALDSNAEQVESSSSGGYPVFYGDVCKTELLDAVGASEAKVIIVTINDAKAAKQVVSSLREMYPKKTIYVRGHSLSQCKNLKKLGATDVVSENVEASLELARMALYTAGVSKTGRNQIIENFRKKYHAQIDAD